MNLPFSKNKSDKEKATNKKNKNIKNKKGKSNSKDNSRNAKNKDKAKKENKKNNTKNEKQKNNSNDSKTVNPEVKEEGQAEITQNKKKSKIALIVTVAAILAVIIAVVLIIFVFPKKNKNNPDSDINNSSSISESSKEDKKDEEESKEISGPVDENGVPLVPDPEFGLLTVDEAMDIVKTQFDSSGDYDIKIYDEKLVCEGNTYTAFTISQGENMIGSPIVVNRKTGEYMCYYPEQMFSHIVDFPLIPADAENYIWNGSFARKDKNGNVTSMLTVKQLEEDEMRFVITTYVKDQSETVSGKAKVKDNVAVYTDGDFFRIEFVMFDSGVTVTESGKNKHHINATFDGKYGEK